MNTTYYTAHRLTTMPEPAVEQSRPFFTDILIRQRTMSQLREYATMNYRDKVIGMNTGTLDVEFLLVFEHGFSQTEALESLEKGETFWQESCNDYLVTGFGLTPASALEALLGASDTPARRLV